MESTNDKFFGLTKSEYNKVMAITVADQLDTDTLILLSRFAGAHPVPDTRRGLDEWVKSKI